MAYHMAALMQTPGNQSDSTVIGQGKTLPDISLGSLGSSFRSDDEENGPARLGVGGARPQVARIPTLPTIDSPSSSIQTPSPPAHYARHHGPSSSSRPSSSTSTNRPEPQSHAPRRNRMLRSQASMSSLSSTSDAEGGAQYGALDGRYDVGGSDSESEAAGVLTNVSINVTPSAAAMGKAKAQGTSKRSGRQSVAPDAAPMTLREQEQELDAIKKDNFNLQLENHFLKERLSKMAPDHIEAALKENVKLKLEILNLSKESKKMKKLVMQQDRDLAAAQRNREDTAGDKGAAAEIKRRYEAELDEARAKMEDVEDALAKASDRADKAEDELERLQRGDVVPEQIEEQMNELRDQLAAAQLDLDRRDQEIDELNGELDAKIREQESHAAQVAADWEDEVAQTRDQIDGLKDALETREQEIKDLREALIERGDDLAGAQARIEELESAQAETADRLEETLRNFEADNAGREADLEAANLEVESLGKRVYELEELVEDLRAREADLAEDLRGADDQYAAEKEQYEGIVAALKEARAKLQLEVEDRQGAVEAAERARRADRSKAQAEIDRLYSENDAELARLRQEAEDALDKVMRGDRELSRTKQALLAAEEGGRAAGGRAEMGVEVDRLRREVHAAQEELDGARVALGRRDAEYAEMLDKQRDLQDALAAERQARLNISDKLDEAVKSAKRQEREASSLRDRIAELEPRLNRPQQVSSNMQKQSEQQQIQCNELLLQVFTDLNRFLGVDDNHTPAEFGAFRETLLSRLRSVSRSKGDAEKRIKEQETAMEQRMGSLKRQLESKWRALDAFESSVKKLESTRAQWRSKYAEQSGELQAAKSRISELNQHLSAQRSGMTASSNSHIRSLTDRAERAEKRAQSATNQLAQLEERMATMQAKTGVADDKWEARVREYENRLRIAGEKIKTEKQGGRERAMQLEGQIRDLQKQIEAGKTRNARVESVVATATQAKANAAHLLPREGSHGSSRD